VPGQTRYRAQAQNDYDCKGWQEQPELLGKQRDQKQSRCNTAPRSQQATGQVISPKRSGDKKVGRQDREKGL
jgi:hypothetical protein